MPDHNSFAKRKRSAIYSDERLTPKDEAFVEALADGHAIKRAALITGVDPTRAQIKAKYPEIIDAVHRRRDAARERAAVSRNDVIEGLKSAIRDAKLLSDPNAQIAGWREIGKMLGYYEPERKVIELSEKKEEALAQLQSMDVKQLIDMAGGNVLDGEFELLEDTH